MEDRIAGRPASTEWSAGSYGDAQSVGEKRCLELRTDGILGEMSGTRLEQVAITFTRHNGFSRLYALKDSDNRAILIEESDIEGKPDVGQNMSSRGVYPVHI